MRPILLLFFSMILSSINSYGQVDFKMNLGVGISTPQLQKQSNNSNTSGQITPVLGLYSSISYNNIELLTGLESSSSKDKYVRSSNTAENEYLNQTETVMSKVSIPLTIGYSLDLGKVKIKPYLGVLYHINMNLSEKISTRTVSNKRLYETNIKHSLNDRYDKQHMDKIQLLAGVELKLTSRLSANLSAAFGDDVTTFYFPHANNGFLSCGLGNVAEINGNNYRMTFNYTLSK